MKIEKCLISSILKLKEKKPIIHNITNYVVMNSSANILLALGASPIMSHCESEVEEIVSLSSALILNIGTIDKPLLKSMLIAIKAANLLNIPVILDPVGVGSSKLRTYAVNKIINEHKVSVIRSNASEILSIYDSKEKTRGVDSSAFISSKIIECSKKISIKYNCVIAVSGKEDIITNGYSVICIKNGDPIMTKITGMGCCLSAVVGSFCAVGVEDIYIATATAFSLYGVCGELAAKNCNYKPGSFFIYFLDHISNLNFSKIAKLLNFKFLQ